MDRADAILNYLQDRLDPDAKTAFEASMAQDPSLAAEVTVMQAVRQDMASSPTHDQADEVWERLLARMDGPAPAANDNRQPMRQLLKYAAVAVLAVAAWQITAVPRLGDTTGFRAASEETDAFVLQVKFAASATMADVRTLLGAIGGTISDGPSALGLVRLSFVDAPSRNAARQALTSRENLVELVLDQ